MLDFSRLKAPAGHGEVLVVPEPKLFAVAARENRTRLDACRACVGGVELAELRRRTRARLLGDERSLVIVAGHQPEFMHAGVWAKHVVGERLAAALGGAAVNLVVDNDAPGSTDLLIPTVYGDSVELRRISSVAARAGVPYESLPALSPSELQRFEHEVREAMGLWFETSMMPAYLQGLQRAMGARDWVEQTVAGRRAAESALVVQVRDVRVSEAWWSPLLAELLLDAARFASAYNEALENYRREHKVRGAARPIPDLVVTPDRVEIPVWAFRAGEPRRRVFLESRGDGLRLIAGDETVCELARGEVRAGDDLVAHVTQISGWRIRPRALSLTMWARLLPADLFIHGIGGAKYDRITDHIIRRYFGIEPPAMACVTATMRLGIGRDTATAGQPAEDVGQKQGELRRILWSPHLGGDHSPAFSAVAREREELAAASTALRERSPREHQTRREVFRRLREVNEQLATWRRQDLERAIGAIRLAEERSAQAKLAGSREYFFALLERGELELLLAALPGEREFGV